MKLLFLIITLIPFLALGLDPATITMTNMRAEEISSASDATFYRSETIHFTNCVALSGTTTSSVPQNLTGLTILLTAGDSVVTSATVTGAVTTATSGVWNASVTLRSDEGIKTFIQLRLTNTTTTFTYPFKYIDVKSKL